MKWEVWIGGCENSAETTGIGDNLVWVYHWLCHCCGVRPVSQSPKSVSSLTKWGFRNACHRVHRRRKYPSVCEALRSLPDTLLLAHPTSSAFLVLRTLSPGVCLFFISSSVWKYQFSILGKLSCSLASL